MNNELTFIMNQLENIKRNAVSTAENELKKKVNNYIFKELNYYKKFSEYLSDRYILIRTYIYPVALSGIVYDFTLNSSSERFIRFNYPSFEYLKNVKSLHSKAYEISSQSNHDDYLKFRNFYFNLYKSYNQKINNLIIKYTEILQQNIYDLLIRSDYNYKKSTSLRYSDFVRLTDDGKDQTCYWYIIDKESFINSKLMDDLLNNKKVNVF